MKRSETLWKVYSLATGFVADVAALAVSAAVSDEVSATLGGIVITAAILGLVPLGSDLILNRSLARMNVVATPEEQGANALTGFAAVMFGAAWTVAGLAAADWLVPNLDIASFKAYVGTLALLWAAAVVIYLPLYLVRRRRAIA